MALFRFSGLFDQASWGLKYPAYLCVAYLSLTSAWAQPPSRETLDQPAPATLIEAWLAFPQLEAVDWPYAYIRADSTNATQRSKRDDLFKEFERLLWRLDARGYAGYADTIREWRDALSEVDAYRLPGTWTPAWLMAHPNQRPPVPRVAAIGACKRPDWIEIWDRQGITRLDWSSGLTLSRLLDDRRALSGRRIDEVVLVSPTGEIARHGVAAWNFAEASLSPGMRVVASLPLDGTAFGWIRDSIAGLLAHTPSGETCRETAFAAESDDV